MFATFSLFVFLMGLFIVQSNAGAASFITPCKRGDNKCILAVAQPAVQRLAAGIPELGVPVSDPFFIDSVRSDDTNLKLGFRNIQIHGAGKCKFIEITRNTEKNTIKAVLQCPLNSVGQYDVKGKLLFIEVYGDGDFNIKTENVQINVEIKLKDIEKDGHKYWKVIGFDYSYDLLKKVYIDLKNLFDGDEKRAKPFKEILDHSWKELIEEVGGPLLKKVIGQYIDVIKTFLLAVPVDQLEIP